MLLEPLAVLTLKQQIKIAQRRVTALHSTWCAPPVSPFRRAILLQYLCLESQWHTRRAAKRGPRPDASASDFSAISLIAFCCGQSGCGKQEAIRHYKVPKPAELYAQNHVDAASQPQASVVQRSTAPTDRLLGAIVPRGDRSWYFKLTGPMDLIATQEPAFRKLVESLTFDGEEDQPTWQMPEDWREKRDDGPRFATLELDVDGKQLEVSVTQLPTNPADTSTLDNVNRWRKQMGLASIEQAQLAEQTEDLALSEGTAVYVNLVGTFAAGGMSPKSLATGGTRNQPPTQASAKTQDEPNLKFETPDGWTRQPPAMFSVLGFGIADGEQTAQVSVSPLRGDGGGMLPNVNRWRRQIGLAAISEDQLSDMTQPLTVDGIDGLVTDVLGDDTQPKAVIGWIGIQEANSWFIKMSGDRQLVQNQVEAFQDFLKTLILATP